MPSKLTVLRSWLTVCLLLFATIAFAQQRTVTGKVTSSKDQQPIFGATVAVKGTSVATQTDANGNFSINLPAGRNVLVFTYVGFDIQEVNAEGNTVNVSMVEQNAALNEVVVTGYTTQRKKDITGAVSVVSVKDMKSIPAGSPEQMLQGQASGVTVITSGAPGGPSNIFIRGITSFGNTDPLVIIDGVPASLHDININDVESIQVLKDAGAASIYGVRGSNGVIVVTTKRGRSGKATITYDGYIGTQRPLSGNVFNTLNPQELANALWTASINSGQVGGNGNPVSVQYGNGATPVLPDYITPGGKSEGDPAVDPGLYNVDYSKGNIYQITRANKAGTDWFHELFKPAMTQSHTISAAGGNEKSTFLFSLGYYNQQGTLIETYLKRYSARINTSFNIKNNVRVGENAYVFYKQNPQIGYNGENVVNLAYREQSIIPVYDIKGNFAGTNGPELGNATNPIAGQIRGKDNIGNTWDIIGNVWGEVDIVKHFTARTSFGGTIDNGYYNGYTFHTYENAENNSGNSFNENFYYNSTWTWTNSLTYTNTFADKHSLKVFGASEAINYYGRGIGGTRLSYFTDDPALRVLDAGSPTNQSLYGYASRESLFSLLGRVDYGYNDKYLLSATIRRDGSSRFGPDKKYGVFPAFSVGWRVTEEDFMKNVSWLNELKLRGSWGRLGSQNNVGFSNQYTQFGSGGGNSYYAITGSSSSINQGFYSQRIGNLATGWEEDIVTNFGLDATLLHNKIDFSVEYYKKKVKGLLFQDQAGATVGGASRPAVNIGDVQNSGLDANATYHGTVSNDLKFNIGLNVTTYKSKVIRIPGQYFSSGGSRIGDFVRNQEGQAISAFYGYQVIGFFADANDVANSPAQTDAAPGRFKYLDANGDKMITADDRVFFGNPNPNFTYGINLSATYKEFDLAAVFYGSSGNDLINYVRYWTDFWASFQGNKSKDLLYNSWTPTRQNAKAPILENKSTFSTNTVVNSYYTENGSYLKCKSLILGYNAPTSLLRSVSIDKLRIYVQATNLFTATKYTGLDPEVFGSPSAFGIDYGNYPNNQKTFIVGVNLTF